jgi:peptidoglycan hydrolase-like protein with peptidoglycan-binding domain
VSTPQPELRRERRMPVRTIGAVSASVIAFPMLASSAQAAPIPYPKPSRTLPAALDVAAFYQEGTRCLTEDQPGAVAFAKLLNTTYGTHTYGILRKCAAEHGEGRALDWMIDSTKPANLALANALTRWLAAPDAQGRPGAMARRFGINYIIFNRQQWKAWAPERGWTAYYGVSPHTDHIHFSFNWDGAYKRTSWWSGVAVTKPLTGPTGSTTTPTTPTPPPAPVISSTGYPVLAQGATGAEVALAQKVIGVTADGRFGPITAAALATWQTTHGLSATRKLDNATWANMVALRLIPDLKNPLAKYSNVVLRLGSTGAAVTALQKAIGYVTVDGTYSADTVERVQEYQASRGLTANGVTDTSVWYALMGLGATPAPTTGVHPLAKYAGLTLKLWSKGEAVSALQKAIGRVAADGSFGTQTEARVKEYQKAKGLTVTGVVDAKVWKTLMTAPTGADAILVTSTRVVNTTEFAGVRNTQLRSGATGSAVRLLQRSLGGLVVDGTFSAKTLAAVKAFQTAKHLPVTGVVDAATWSALELKVHPLLPYYRTVVKRGSTGPAVVALQKALRMRVSGTFGPRTEEAVKLQQENAKLTQTGVVGSLTWKAIEARMVR